MAVFTIGSKTLSGSPTGGAVGGASNLTTVGAIPYVSASGVLNQDATNFFWDATNHRLGVGTASPSASIDVRSTTGIVVVNTTDGQPSFTFGQANAISGIINTASNAFINFNSGGAQSSPMLQIASGRTGTSSGTVVATFLGSGNAIFGSGTTDGNYKLDVQKSGSTGTLRVYDQTATTGSTLAVIQAGAGQSGNLQEWRNNAGSALANVTGAGDIYSATLSVTGNQGSLNTSGLLLSSGSKFAWSSTSSWAGSLDTGLARNAAGVLEIDSGTAGQYRDLILRRSQHSGVTVSTLPAAAAGNAGSIQYVTDANATTISSVVAGGGSNKVLVWSDGTNWKIMAN